MRWVLLPLLVVMPVAAFAAEKDEAALQKKLETLEAENAKLREQLAKKQQDRQKLFDDATRAEQAAGLVFRKTTAVASQAAPPATPAVGAPNKHGVLRLQKAEVTLDVNFGAARNVKAWRVHDGTCDVQKKNK